MTTTADSDSVNPGSNPGPLSALPWAAIRRVSEGPAVAFPGRSVECGDDAWGGCFAEDGWRGTLDEADATKELARFIEDAFTFSEARSGGHILTYFIPGL